MARINVSIKTEILKGLFTSNGKDEAFARLMEEIFNQVLEAEATEKLGAEYYERNKLRKGYRNGHRERSLNTRIGELKLSVPRLRSGEFSPELFKRYQRSEQALLLTMMEMVVNGVSTRKVKRITEELCGESFSKSTVSNLVKSMDPYIEAFRNRELNKRYPFLIVDGIYTKVRENGRVRSKGILIATGINEEGIREVVGFTISDTETENSWREFFQGLKARGLKQVDIVVSDAHGGLRKALKKEFHNVTFQRCQTHFAKNISDNTPKKMQKEVMLDLHRLYNAMDMEEARMYLDRIIVKYGKRLPKIADMIEEHFDEITAVMSLPEKYRKRLRTTNSLERLNEELRRRERVIRIFPNEESAIRMMGALLMEYNEQWMSGKKYFDMTEYYSHINEVKEVVHSNELT